jgi:DNA-binding MarR family transcriptional regulator
MAVRDGLLDALAETAFATMAVLNEVSGENDLSLTQLRVLAILRDRRLGMTALADHLGLEKSTMTGLVERAEKRGLLVREPSSADGRAVEVRLTKEGAKLAAGLKSQVLQRLSPRIEKLAPSERRQLQGLLDKILSNRAR